MSSKKRFFLFFILVIFFGLFFSTNFCHAANLEVDYPEIKNFKPTGDTQLPQYLKYVFDFGIFLGFFAVFLSLIWAGVLYLFSPAIPNALSDARDRVSGAISGLLILALLYLIITTINPELKFFKLNQLEPIPPPPPEQTKPAGIYLYKTNNCSGEYLYLTSGSKDFGPSFNNQINSINIINDPIKDIYFVTILFDTNNNHGRCMYMVKTGCQQIDPGNNYNFGAISASVFRYEFNPSGDGVYFVGKGGYCRIDNSKINGIFASNLNDLYFTDFSDCAPDTRRCNDRSSRCTLNDVNNCDCKQWAEDGTCTDERHCPSIAGENVFSIVPKGNYVTVLVYFGPGDPEKTGPWTDCQAYPTVDDVNKAGGIIKWDAIKNNNYGRLPNWTFILPVKQN